MKFLREMSSFDSGFFTGVVGLPADGEEIVGLLTAGVATGVPTAAVGLAGEPSGVPIEGLAPTGVPTAGLDPTGVPTVGLEAGAPMGVPTAGFETGVPTAGASGATG